MAMFVGYSHHQKLGKILENPEIKTKTKRKDKKETDIINKPRFKKFLFH